MARRIFFPSPLRGRASGRLPLIAASFLLISIMTLSLWSIRQEKLILAAQQRLDAQSRQSQDPFQSSPASGIIEPPVFAPPRYLLADALYLAGIASTAGDPRYRSALLDRAGLHAREAAAARPHWGEARIAIAYVESQRSSAMTDAERRALILSYDDAPYLPDAGLWRITRGLAYWQTFPPVTQNRILREAIWLLCRVDGDSRYRIFTMARRSRAYIPLFLAYGQSKDCR